MPDLPNHIYLDLPTVHDHAEHGGVYHKTSRLVNSYPVWQHVAEKAWLYRSSDFWFFTVNKAVCDLAVVPQGLSGQFISSSEEGCRQLSTDMKWDVRVKMKGQWMLDKSICLLVSKQDILVKYLKQKSELQTLKEQNLKERSNAQTLEEHMSVLQRKNSDLLEQRIEHVSVVQALKDESAMHLQEKADLEREVTKLKTYAQRFPKVAKKYPDVIAEADWFSGTLCKMESVLEERDFNTVVDEAISQHVQDWLPTDKLKAYEATDMQHSELQSLQSLHDVMSTLMVAQPGLLGNELGRSLCSQLEVLLLQKGGLFAQEEQSLQSLIQLFVMDLKVQVEQRSQELSMVLNDQTSREHELLEKVRESSHALSKDEFLAAGTSVEQARMHATIELLQVLRDKYVAASKGEVLTDLLLEKRTSFEKEQEAQGCKYKNTISAYRAHQEETKQKLQQWEMYVEKCFEESKSARDEVEDKEQRVVQMQQSGSFHRFVEATLVLEEARAEATLKDKCAAQAASFSATHSKELQAEQFLAEQLAERSEQGRKLQQEFASWIRSLYDGIDVRAESNLTVFRQELPRDLEKFKQLHMVARADVERRMRQTWEAVPGTQSKLSQSRAEVSRLQRCRCVDERLNRAKLDYEALLADVRSLKKDLHALKAEDEKLKELTPLTFSKIEDSLPHIPLSCTALSQDWVKDIFFTQEPLDPCFVELMSSCAALRPGASQSLSLGSSVTSRMISECEEGSEDGDFTVVDQAVHTHQLTMSAPPLVTPSQCFLPECELLTPVGPVPISKLTLGSELLALGGECAVVKALRSLQPRDQDVMTILFEDAYAKVTASHLIPEGASGQALEAGELDNSSVIHFWDASSSQDDADKVEIISAPAVVTRKLESISVIEVELSDPNQAIFLRCTFAESKFRSTCGDRFVLVFGAPPQKTLFAVAGKPGTCLTITDKDPRDVVSSCHSDPTHVASPMKRIVRTIRPPHDDKCTAVCRYHLAGKCRSGALCPRCHHPSHYEGRYAPTHRSSRGNKRRQDVRSQSAGPF